MPLKKLLDRIAAIAKHDQRPDPVQAAAVLGTKQPPAVSVEKALDMYWGPAKDKTFGKSPDQIRRWQNPRKKVVRNFVAVVGNKSLSEITADDMLEFRDYWQERIEVAGRNPSTANKDFVHLGDILKTVNRMKRLGLELRLGGLAFKEG
ncbi:hypothetical protein [uncultured Pelagimonas sp.]|uniref:hypothetical protein n=1 Tax=uncultured Pelagimonas sp. TaxID=1618102 RepID=UPI00260B2868|nr:hypothetical protein [uncultured Pelagimonas sp.]